MTNEGKATTWDRVTAGDRVLSAKTGRWYDVVETTTGERKIRARLAGVPKAFLVDPGAPVQAVRGESAHAIDMLADAFGAQILSSGPIGGPR